MIKIVSINTRQTYEIDAPKGGENYMPCPECSANRKKQRAKCFSWNNEKAQGKCHNCESAFVLWTPTEKEKQYTAPVWKNKTELTDKAAKWFEGRMISQKTLAKMRIYSDIEFMPQTSKEESVICFPFFDDEKLVNIKYRDGAKNFKLVQGAERILYNINGIKNSTTAIIVEGEIDCLTFIECGFENCVSVPNGAGTNTDYLDKYIELLESKELIYIATDNDSKGIDLRNELIRRLGAEKCAIVNFRDKKDANELIIAYGGNAVRDAITNAIEIPVSGIVNLSKQYDDIYNLFLKGMEKGLSIDDSEIDKLITWELGRLAVVTGIPSHGKSEVVDFILTKLNLLYGWKVGYFSPENYPIKYHFAKVMPKLVGKEFKAGYISQSEYEYAFDYINSNFYFIYPEDDMTFENILEKAKYLVKKRGIKVLVIDPYNKIEHTKNRGESETEYISRFLDKLSTFAKTYSVLVVLVAHPTKMKKELTGKYEVPSLYDISGSANFYNKCDYGLSIYRNFDENTTDIYVLKVKFKHLGEGGKVTKKYNYRNGRYESENSDVNSWDNSNWLNKNEIKPEDLDDDYFKNLMPVDVKDIPF